MRGDRTCGEKIGNEKKTAGGEKKVDNIRQTSAQRWQVGREEGKEKGKRSEEDEEERQQGPKTKRQADSWDGQGRRKSASQQ